LGLSILGKINKVVNKMNKQEKEKLLAKLDDKEFREKLKQIARDMEQEEVNTVEKEVEKDAESEVGPEEEITYESIREKALAIIPDDVDFDVFFKVVEILKEMD